MYKLVLIYLSCFIAVFLLGGLPISRAETQNQLLSKIIDPNLRQCIFKLMENHGWSKAAQVQSIKCHNKKINSAEGIEQFSNIHTLSLYNNNLQSIRIEQFGKLESINVANNGLKGVTLLEAPKLNKLFLFKNKLSDLSLNNLPSLTQVKANDNNLELLTVTATPNLIKLYLFNNQLESIDLIATPQLRYLDVRQNPMPDDFYDFLDEQDNLTARHDGNADDWE